MSTARAEASQITAELQADQQHLDVVAQQYDAAQQQVQQLQQQITQIKAAVASDQAQVAKDQANLRQQAVDSYMTGSAETGLSTLFGTGNEQAAVTNEYQSVASGNISDAVDSVDRLPGTAGRPAGPAADHRDPGADGAGRAATARQAAQATVAGQEATLSRVTGEIATLVAQQQATQQAAEHAAYIARLNSANAVATTALGGHPSFPNLPAAGGAARAVAAAKSQLGVPYVWGGESPGVGFDCSGLTQWSWRQAGVSLPRTAAAQYDAIAHIPLSDLQPGDLAVLGLRRGDLPRRHVRGRRRGHPGPRDGRGRELPGHLGQRAGGRRASLTTRPVPQTPAPSDSPRGRGVVAHEARDRRSARRDHAHFADAAVIPVGSGSVPASAETEGSTRHGDGIPATRPSRPPGQCVVVRLLGDLRPPAGRGSGG